jgi:ubiquinone/menaquinone biosynthesis C-methylase UbiE
MIYEASAPQVIDVRKLMQEISIEELCRSAEEFFQQADLDCLQAKPFADVAETPELLICFAHVVRGLNLLPDMTVLDFGAGSCWTSHFLTQLGLKVIALDVSQTALEIGRKLYSRHPIFGDQPKPQFLLFDGQKINLPDDSVDRISCWAAFHHVPNPNQVIREMGRVLRKGGIAGFSEPGPDHSKSEQSQYEMRTNRVIENDTNVHEIWRVAQEAGFTDIKLALFNADPVLLSLQDFDDYLIGRDSGERYDSEVRQQMQQRRVFFLFKSATTTFASNRRRAGMRSVFVTPHINQITRPLDSQRRAGLRRELHVTTSSTRVRAGKELHLNVTVKNTGRGVWLPTPEAPLPWWKRGVLARLGRRPHMGPDRVPPRAGGVRFGIQLLNDQAQLLDIDYFRYHLTPGEGREIHPGEKIEFAIEVPMLRMGKYILQCDLVSEAVCWFERTGSPPLLLTIEVT